MRGKTSEVIAAVGELKSLVLGARNQRARLQEMVRQTYILDLLILYCKIINSKTGCGLECGQEIYILASQELNPLQACIF
jgi:hypothetical protein